MIYKCVNCGGNVVFDPQSGHMKCLSCGGSDCEQSIPSETPMICPSCGSHIGMNMVQQENVQPVVHF